MHLKHQELAAYHNRDTKKDCKTLKRSPRVASPEVLERADEIYAERLAETAPEIAATAARDGSKGTHNPYLAAHVAAMIG